MERKKTHKPFTSFNSEVWEIIVYSMHTDVWRLWRHKESHYACKLKQMLFVDIDNEPKKKHNNQTKMHIKWIVALFPFAVQLVVYSAYCLHLRYFF